MAARPTFDLQSHSHCSDGTLSPTEVVAAAAAAGVELLSLTDHDAVDGVAEAVEAGERLGVRVVPGTELSALDGVAEDLHICGYGLDVSSPALLAALREFREDRNARGGRMLEALAECGWALDRDAVDARAAAGNPVGRPHLAGAVFTHPANAVRLAAEELRSPGDVLVAYLIPGAPAYRRRTTPTVAEAIGVIHDAGGLAVWAHPFWDVENPKLVVETVARFAALGLDGVECFYVAHDEAQTRVAYDAARTHGLLTSGSTDFHGPGHHTFAAFRGFELFGLEPVLGPLSL